MDVNQLRNFMTVAETLNFTHAANQLYMSQTTLSYQISSLEKELGVKLFNRQHGKVTLTASGEKLLERTPSIIRQVDEAIRAAKSADEGRDRVLRIGFLGRHEYHFLPSFISAFNDRHPDIDTMLIQAAPDRLKEKLQISEVDLIFILDRERATIDGFEVDYFERMPMFAIMRSDNELVHRESLTRADLIDQKLCFMSKKSSIQMNADFIKSFEAVGYNSARIDTSATMESVMMLVEAKGYVTVCPECMKPHTGNLVAVPMKNPDEYVFHGMAWRNGDQNPTLRLFIEEARPYISHCVEPENLLSP